jgi:regulator of sigma E protease
MSLSLLIILHELGHFIPAKIFKTRVEKFYLFFDVKFSLFKKKIGDTVYGIGWLPLGGYVKISGMIDESMDVEAMKEEPKPWEFRSKPAWQRLIIMTGGVIVNFILAVVIYIGMAYSYGEQFIANESVKDGVYVAYPEIGDQLGIQTGDKIIAVDGEPIERFSQIFMEIVNGNEITIDRDGQLITQEIPVDFISTLLEDQEKARFLSFRQPFVIGEVTSDSANASAGLEAGDQFISINGQPSYYVDQAKELLDQNKGGQITALVEDQNGARRNVTLSVNDEGKIGIAFKLLTMDEYQERGIFEVETKKYSLVESIPVGIDKGVSTLTGYVKQVKKIVNPETGAYKGVGGFAAIGGLFPDSWNWEAFWGTTALISIILAFMNILPIPALDGGHVMFLLYEMISGRKPSDKFLEYAQLVGFVLLLGLLVFANGNDIYKLFVK